MIKKAELKDCLAIARKAFDKQIKEKEVVINKEVNCLDSGLLFDLGCGPLHAWQVRVLFGMWEKHELIGLNTISSCFFHILKRTHTCHACNGLHPKSSALA